MFTIAVCQTAIAGQSFCSVPVPEYNLHKQCWQHKNTVTPSPSHGALASQLQLLHTVRLQV